MTIFILTAHLTKGTIESYYTGKNMKCLNLALIILAVLFPAKNAYCQTAIPAQDEIEKLKALFESAHSFDDIFAFNRQIKFKTEELVGEISQVEANSKGDFLIFDRPSKNILLFDNDGKLIKILGIEKSYPGIKWDPLGAWFSQDNKILIQIRKTQNLFLFDSSGEFLQSIPSYFPPEYKDFVMSREGAIYGYAIHAATPALKKLDLTGEVIAEGGVFEEPFIEFIQRSSGGGIEIDGKGNIFQINSSGPELYKHSSNLKNTVTIKRKPGHYKQINTQIPKYAKNPAGFINSMNKILYSSTLSYSIHLYKGTFLIIQYVRPGIKNGIYLDICDLEGTYYTNRTINYGVSINAVYNNFVYKKFQPGKNANGELPNPVLREYKLKH